MNGRPRSPLHHDRETTPDIAWWQLHQPVHRRGANLRVERTNQVTTTITVMLLVLAAVNTVFMAWATVTDASHPPALARALGATPQQVSAGLSAAQLLPAGLGAVAGLPAGLYLYRAATQEPLTVPPPWWQLLAVLLGTLLAVAAVPARLGGRRPVVGILSSEAA